MTSVDDYVPASFRNTKDSQAYVAPINRRRSPPSLNFYEGTESIVDEPELTGSCTDTSDGKVDAWHRQMATSQSSASALVHTPGLPSESGASSVCRPGAGTRVGAGTHISVAMTGWTRPMDNDSVRS
jgi:hypothetical protein